MYAGIFDFVLLAVFKKKYNLLLETERLLLKPTDSDDSDFLIRLLNTPKYYEFIGDRKVRTAADVKVYMKERIFRQHRKFGFGNFTVIRKSDKEKLGTCGIYYRNVKDLFDIGFAFLPEHEGKGYAFEAAEKVRDFGMHTVKLKLLRAFTTKENVRSQKLLKKLNFEFKRMDKLPFDEEELMLFEYSKADSAFES